MRSRRRNPDGMWLLGGAVLLGGGALFFLSRTAKAAGGGALGGKRLVAGGDAIVTTSDPAPAGDVFLRRTPDSPGVPGVGAEKGGTVNVINPDVRGDGQWAHVQWFGGPRLDAAEGFVLTKFLRPA